MAVLIKDAEDLIKSFERCRLRAYDDATGKTLNAGDKPIGTVTIGWGHTATARPGLRWTQAQADKMFRDELTKFRDGVLAACTLTPTDYQLGAMTSFAYNCGLAGFRRSTVLKAHNRGDHDAAARAFGLWNRASGKVSRGLTRRRKAEAELYLTPAGETPAEPMPQSVEPETNLAQSPIAVGGAASAAASGAGLIGIAADAAQGVGSIRDSLGDWLPYVLVAVLLIGLIAGGVIVFNRIKQRREGWS